MADYVAEYTCGTCSEFEYAGQYTKGYCRYYGSYYHHDDSCSHWERDDSGSTYSSSGGCFLTTACCEYRGLPDDCEELQTLRAFRDEYIRKQPYGEELIRLYYDDAPYMVEEIKKRADSAKILEMIYESVCEIVEQIRKGEKEKAVTGYCLMTWKIARLVLYREALHAAS